MDCQRPEANLITMWVFRDRRSFGNATEKDAARQRGMNEWMRSRFAPQSTRSRPQLPPGSKVQLKVVKWRKPLNELELATLRPYVPNPFLTGRIRGIVKRVAAAGERIRRERQRADLEQTRRERRERLSAPPAPISNVLAFQPAATKVKHRWRRRAKVISLKRA